ncbi:MAG TPA: hypothetical protein VJP02_22865 [Candidatus Sulfotelmatobacter sp.]|nr:hypothetical protein [Candidatus Sulfotelmatobacter sp.]
MKPVHRRFINILGIMATTFLWFPSAAAQEDVATIIRRSSEANNRDWTAVPEFDNYERDRNKDGDKTYAVTMLYGSHYERLIEMNGHPLPAARQKQEQEKYDKAVAERQHESPEKRSQRIAKYQAERKRDYTLIEQMTTAFDFRLAGKRVLNGYKVYVLHATPRKGYKPPDRDSQVGMEGTLWIDQQKFQWVKVEAHVVHPVRIEGFLAQVEPGTRFEVEKRPVTSDIWLASHFSMKSSAKIMLLFPHRGEEDDLYFHYHKAENTAVGQ